MHSARKSSGMKSRVFEDVMMICVFEDVMMIHVAEEARKNRAC